jgi:hypothetical protein
MLLLASITVLGSPLRSSAAEPAPHLHSITFTAFPDLKPPVPDGTGEVLTPALPELPPDAPPLRKVLRAQAREGFNYLWRMGEVIKIGSWNYQYLHDHLFMVRAAYRVAADLEDRPADRVPWYEERVRKLKELEQFIEGRVRDKKAPPEHLLLARFTRLGAEADLLRLQGEVGGGAARPLVMKKSEAKLPDPRKKLPGPPTAFPDIKPPTVEAKAVKKPDGTTKVVYEEKLIVPLPRLPLLPADAGALGKVRHEQVLEGFGYLQIASPVPFPLIDAAPPDFVDYFRVVADTYRMAAELEGRLADRVPWYEAHVRALKGAERYAVRRVELGTAPPQNLDMICFLRLQAEAELLRLKAAVDSARPARGPALARGDFLFDERWGRGDVKPRPHYTAFPDLKPRAVELVEEESASGGTKLVARYKDAVPMPPLPVVGVDAPLARRVRVEQVRAGLAYLDPRRELVPEWGWVESAFRERLRVVAEVYRVAAELEDTPAKRVPWYEARVIVLKDIEQFIARRVPRGVTPPQYLNRVRVARLQAEAELLALKAAAEAPAVAVPPVFVCSPCPPVYCPPACASSRPRLLPRLFHRR